MSSPPGSSGPLPAAAAGPVLALHRAGIGYDERLTVRGVDLSIWPGEVVALVGPNGSGKTTLVRGLIGLAELLQGEVELFGQPLARFKDRSRLGYVPQRQTVGGAVPSTVEEVVSSGRLARKRWFSRWTVQDRAAVDAAIGSVGLIEYRRAPIGTLSGGQQRRALIARALAGEPEMLVMDEPTAGVDAESQASLVRTLTGLVHRGLTLLVVTHEVTPLLPILTRVVELHNGRIVEDQRLGTAGPDGLPHGEEAASWRS